MWYKILQAYSKVKTNSLYHRPKRSSNKIRKSKFEFGKKTNLTSLISRLVSSVVYCADRTMCDVLEWLVAEDTC